MGLFDSFDNLNQISAEAVASWLKNAPELTYLANYLANRILYPQALPQTEYQMQIDLAILREALKLNSPPPDSQKTNPLLGGNPFLNVTLRKVLIPVKFLNLAPDLISLVWVFIDALLLNRKKEDWFGDLWTVVLTDDTDEVIGSIILPQFGQKGVMELILMDKKYKILRGSLTAISCLRDRCQITYKLQDGSILGKTEDTLEVSGGKLGLIIDGRSK